MPRSARNLAAMVGAAFALLTVPAHATIVYVHDGGSGGADEVRAMNDDGTNVRTLLTEADLAGGTATMGSGTVDWKISELYGASVHPTGTAVVFTGAWDQGFAEAWRWDPQAPSGACGAYCYGVYALADGAVRRLSPNPFGCPLNPCAIFEQDPEVAADGSVVMNRAFYNYASRCLNPYRWCDSSSEDSLVRRPGNVSGGDGTAIETHCQDGEDPAPHPTEAGTLVHVGCADFTNGSNYQTSLIDASGASPLYSDDWHGKDVSYSPDGTQIATFESDIGADPGIWVNTIPPTDASDFRRALALAKDEPDTTSPRLTSTGKLLFLREGNIYALSADCNACTFAQATAVTTHGKVDAAGFGWTSQANVPALNRPEPVDPVITPGPGPTPCCSPPPGPGPVTDPVPPKAPAALATGLKAVAKTASARKGFRFRLKLGKALKVLARVETAKGRLRKLGSATFKGRTGANTFVLRKAGGKALKPGVYRAIITITDGGKLYTVGTLKFTLRR